MTEQKVEDPEAVLKLAADCLSESDGNAEDDIDWPMLCSVLSHAGEATWYRCACGKISPSRGSVDAVCPVCGEIRRLPARLSRAPWPLYVRCLMHAVPDWFSRLSKWLEAESLGHAGGGGAYARHAHSDAGGGACRSGAEDSSAGDVPPKKCIECIDGMKIFENGDVCGTAWIALPMPDVELLKKIQ